MTNHTFSHTDLNMLKKMADTVRFLCADMIQKANSGHPGAPFGLADVVTVLSQYFRHNPKNSSWINRDRLVFSGGHTSAMAYALLHLWGYDLSLDDLKSFRQFSSKTPGHPEYQHTDGIEVTTGPLGQGVANAVGFAMAAKYASHLLNRADSMIIDHKVYCLCGDGDLQEGISYEACSLAGHHALDNLVMIFDSNNITIEGDTSLAFSEDIVGRFCAQGWDVQEIDGHDYGAIDSAFQAVQNQKKPCLIVAKTTIAKGTGELEGSHKTHGAPLGESVIRAAKDHAGFDSSLCFHIPEDVLLRFRCAIEKGDLHERRWHALLRDSIHTDQSEIFDSLQNPDFSRIVYPDFASKKAMATRESNGHILNAIAKAIPSFMGGSADLAPSNKTELVGMGHFPHGRNFHFGIREHAMAAITNGIARYGLFLPFSATFFVFSDYMSPACRLAALMKLKTFFIWSHDSIGVGEDGATHQPIEQLTQVRALPRFYTFRPSDANENSVCWQVALTLEGPSAFVTSRQALPVRSYNPILGGVENGAYMIYCGIDAQVTLLASGSEVSLALEGADALMQEGISVNVVSVPCFDLFVEQSKEYIDSIVIPDTKVLALEASRGLEWYRFADDVLGMNDFGLSAPSNALFEHFGFTVSHVVSKVKTLLL
jgi:transketolase